MIQEQHELQVFCKDCNAYLFSKDSPNYYPDPLLISCPCKLDPMGKCTGVYQTTPSR